MKKIGLLLITAFLVFIYTPIAFSSEYITIREYNRIHPDQAEISKHFKSIVQQDGSPLPKGIQKKAVRIVFIYPGKQVSDYWRRSIKSFTGRMDEIGIQYKIKKHFTKVGEIRIQAQQLQAAIAGNPDYLVYTLNVMKHKKLIERILTKGRPKLILQNITTPIRDWEGKQPFLYVGFDHTNGTEYLAKHLLKITGGRGDYGMLYFTQGYVSTMRGDTFIQYLKDNSAHHPVASYYTDGKHDKSKAAVLEIVREHDVKFLYACATDTAFGAIEALRETGKSGQIPINGWGGGSQELKAIMKGEMDFTVMRMNDDNGVAMAEAVRLDIEKKADRVPTIYSGDFALVKKGISREKLTKLKSRAFRYSGMD